jgi:hypothetical protein
MLVTAGRAHAQCRRHHTAADVGRPRLPAIHFERQTRTTRLDIASAPDARVPEWLAQYAWGSSGSSRAGLDILRSTNTLSNPSAPASLRTRDGYHFPHCASADPNTTRGSARKITAAVVENFPSSSRKTFPASL